MNLQNLLRNLLSNSQRSTSQAGATNTPTVKEAPQLSENLDVFNLPEPPNKKAKEYLEAYRGWVYACVRAITKNVSDIEFVLFRRKQNGDVEKIEEHEILDLLTGNINPVQTTSDFISAYQTYLELSGESFIYKFKPNRSARPTELWILRPDYMKVLPPKKKGQLIGGYEYRVAGAGKSQFFEPDEIIHQKLFNPLNPYRGMGTLQAADYAYDTDFFATKWNRNFFFNNAMPNSVLTSDKKLSDKQIKRIRREFKSKFGGTSNAHKLAILGGGLKFDDAFKLSMKDMDFHTLRKYSRDELFAMFQVPKSIVSITDDVNRANALEHRSIFIENRIMPEMNRLTNLLNEFLVSEWDENLYLGFKDPTPNSTDLDLRIVKEAGDILTVNERREIMGYDMIEGGDVISIPFSANLNSSLVTGEEEEQEDQQTQERMIRVKRRKQPVDKGVIVRHRRTKREILTKNIKSQLAPELRKMTYMLMSKKKKLTKQDKKAFEKREVTQEMAESFWKQMISKTDGWEEQLRARLFKLAGDQQTEVVTRIGDRKGKRKQVDPMLFDLAKWIEKYREDLIPLISTIIATRGADALEFMELPQTFSFTANVRDFIDGDGSKFIREINETTRSELKETLGAGITAGEGVPDLRKRVQEVFTNYNRNRTHMIARTETLRASNFAHLEGFKQSGVVIGKEWLIALDERTCEFCLQMDEKYKKANLDEEFYNGEKLTGVEGGVIGTSYAPLQAPPLHPRCRCTIVPVIGSK